MDHSSDYLGNNTDGNQQLLSADQAPHSKRRSRNSELCQESINRSDLLFNSHALPPLRSTSQDQCTPHITQMSTSVAEPFYNSNRSSSDYHMSPLDMNPQRRKQQQVPQHSLLQSEYDQYTTNNSRRDNVVANNSQIQQSRLQQAPTNLPFVTDSSLPVVHHHQQQQRQFLNHGFPDQGHLQSSQEQQSIFTMQDQTTHLQSSNHITMRTPYIQPINARNPLERPVVKLSVNLIDTYKRINENYYKNKRRRENAEAAAAAAVATAAAAATVTKADKPQERKNQAAVHNHGWDDENYDYILRRGEVLEDRYRVEERIGKGSFGQVVRAFDMVSNTDVAIKIIKSRRPFLLQARTEIELLTHLKDQDSKDQYNIVRLHSHFMHKNHQCLVFEMLSLNLYELLKNTQFEGVSLNLIRKFAKQILKALQFLSRSDVDVIHCDLKPENILLKHPKRSGIKVIDFGSSCRSNRQMYSYIQSRFYRSPEVLLGLPYSVAIDMWSLGCILVEMHTGEPLFSGIDQFDQMQKIVKILGMVPNDIIYNMNDQQRSQFFEMGEDGHWTIKQGGGNNGSVIPSTNPRESLKAILQRSTDSQGNYDVFVEMIHQMLSYRPRERITATEALEHPFIVAGEHS